MIIIIPLIVLKSSVLLQFVYLKIYFLLKVSRQNMISFSQKMELLLLMQSLVIWLFNIVLLFEHCVKTITLFAANAAIKINRVTKNIRRFSMKRPSIRQRKGKQGKNIKGKVIDNVHELHTLTMGMMLGLKCSVSLLLEP